MICPHCQLDTDDVSEIANVANMPANVQWFDAFWQLYPRKVAKASALKSWRKVCTSEAIKDEIMAGLERCIQGWHTVDFRRHVKLELQFIPYPATWLNGRRWEDESTPCRVTPNVARHIACDKCGDSGIRRNSFGLGRCSCPRGQLPGLIIPQAEEIDSAPF